MARIRSIKSEVRTSLVVAEWPREVRYFWVLLWGYLDDRGHGVDDARLVKADCMPLDDDVTAATVDEWLTMISGGSPEGFAKSSPEASGPLCRYRVDGRRFMHAVNWREHQRPSHPKASHIPKCPIHEGAAKEPQVTTPSGGSPEGLAKPSGDPPEGLVPEQVVRAGSREQGEKTASAKPPRDVAPLREDVERLCEHLADRIEANGSKRPSITQGWRDAARLMLDRDGRTETDVVAAIGWCQGHDFWRSNILSMPKLREKYDQLRLQACRDRGTSSGSVVPIDRRMTEHAALISQLAAQENSR